VARRCKPLLVLVGGAALASALIAGAAPRPRAAFLEIENDARAHTTRIALADGEFEVTSQHSIYDAPVTELYQVAGDGIVQRAVSSPSAAVREYFGLTAPGERHEVVRELPEIVFRIATGTPQRLRVANEDWSFLEFGEHGDRLILRGCSR
jgi:hypothetical protein